MKNVNTEILETKSLIREWPDHSLAGLLTSTSSSLFRTAWKPWAPTSAQSASCVPTVAKYLQTLHSTLRTDFPIVKKVRTCWELVLLILMFIVFRLEWTVHHQVYILWIPNRSRRPMGGSSEQQLPLPVLQLHGMSHSNTIFQAPSQIYSWPCVGQEN